MALEEGKDYVLAQKITQMGGAGILEALLVGTRDWLFVVPFNSIGGAGRTMETRSYTLGEGDPRQTIPALLAEDDLTVEGLEEVLLAAVGDEDSDGKALKIADFERFKIEVGGGLLGWLKAGLYYSMPGKRGWKGMAVKSKPTRQAMRDFYEDQIRLERKSAYET